MGKLQNLSEFCFIWHLGVILITAVPAGISYKTASETTKIEENCSGPSTPLLLSNFSIDITKAFQIVSWCSGRKRQFNAAVWHPLVATLCNATSSSFDRECGETLSPSTHFLKVVLGFRFHGNHVIIHNYRYKRYLMTNCRQSILLICTDLLSLISSLYNLGLDSCSKADTLSALHWRPTKDTES